MRFLAVSSAVSTLLFTFSAFADVLPKSQLEALAYDSQWLSMLHYDQIGLIKQHGSQIEDSRFFLSPRGQKDAVEELIATIDAFQSLEQTSELNQLAQCRFPGRFAWLKSRLPHIHFEEIVCSEFEEWKNKINAEKIYLVFPSAYLNSPSSMYGHTLFRVKKKGNDTPLLDFAVNYAANTDPSDNQLVFSYKGLTGGYPGVASVMPYYQKVKEYNFLENRDIWEYELLLTDQEVDQFIRHIWEIKGTSIPYYFISQNCSYQLLTMLDAASPRLNLASQFSLWAIPADTVREVKAQGVLGKAEYRPSSLKIIESMLDQVEHSQIEIAKRLVIPEQLDVTELNQLSEVDKAQTLDIAYEYSRYLSARKKSTLAHLSSRSIKLLSLRSKLDVSRVFFPVSQPAVRDDQGHSTSRIGVALRHQLSKQFGIIDYRPSYHDVLDPQGGYLKGAELSMFSGSLRLKDSVELNHFNFVNIHSMASTNALMMPKSWHINASLIRDVVYDDDLLFRLHGGAGVTSQLSPNVLVGGFLNGRVSIDSELDKGHLLQSGPELKWLWNGNKSNALASYQYLFDLNSLDSERHEATLAYSYDWAKDWQWRIENHYTHTNSDSWNSVQFTLFHYF